jgi:hypothetical protein
MPRQLPNSFKEPLAGQVDAGGSLIVKFGPQYNEMWDIQQVTLEMETAPNGAVANLRVMGSLVAPAPSPRRATASGQPPIFLYGGETMSVEWENCTPGDVGKVLVVYLKSLY